MGKHWVTSGRSLAQWEREQAAVIPRGEERLWFLLTWFMRPPPQKSTCPGGTGDLNEMTSSCLTHHNTFCVESSDCQPAEHGDREMSFHREWLWGSQWAFAASIQIFRGFSGREKKGSEYIWMWSNKRFLTKRFELSVEIPKRIVHIFLMRPNWKNRFWKNAFDELNPLPWVLQSTRKAQSPLEPVTKSNTSTWKIEFERTQTLSFKPGHSKVVWPQAESWSDDRWVHSVTLLWITSFFFICFPAVSTARKK